MEYLQLPPYSDVTSLPPSCFRSSGLGYDVVTDDYKVVRLAQSYDANNRSYRLETLVYSVKLDCWKRIDDFPNYFLRKSHEPGVFAYGALHWLTFIREPGVAMNYIIAFDLGTETYRVISIPLAVFESEKGIDRVYLDGLGGCLFLTCYHVVGHLDVWKMNDYGGEELWVKLFSFKQPVNMGVMKMMRPVAYLKNKEQVLMMYNREEFVWFDIRKKSAKRVTIDGAPGIFDLQAFPASLVRLNSSGRASTMPALLAFPASVVRLNSIRHAGETPPTTPSGKKRKISVRGHDRLKLTLTTTDLQLSPADNLPPDGRVY